jgi:probable rRNA maturation factor
VAGEALRRRDPAVVVTRPRYLGPWRIEVTIRNEVRPPVSGAALARAIVAAAEAAGAPSPASVGLVLTDDAEIAGLNASHLGQDGPTDVLSFPFLPPDAFPPHPGGPAHLGPRNGQREPVAAFALPPGRRPHLGDIVISVERATSQALEGRGGQTGTVRWSPADELRLLATHGTLHLCGWDHAEPVEEAAMRALETRLLGRRG